MIKETAGNLFEAKAKALINAVNYGRQKRCITAKQDKFWAD
jgi:hypothetical protein